MKAILFLLITACLASELMLVPEPETPATDFVKGFLEAIHETKKVEDFMKCLKDLDPIIAKIKKALDYFLKMTPEDLLKGFKLLMEALKDLETMLKPCIEGAQQLKKLMDNIRKADIMKIILKILANPSAFIKDFKEAIEALKKMNFYVAGKAIGDVLYRLFLTRAFEEEDTSIDGFFAFFEGFISGINTKSEYGNFEECMKKIPTIYYQVMAIIEALKNINWSNLDEAIHALIVLVDMVKEAFRSIKPCKGMPEDLKKIGEKFSKIDANKFMANVMTHLMDIMTSITNLFAYWQKGLWRDTGVTLGELIHLLFLSLE